MMLHLSLLKLGGDLTASSFEVGQLAVLCTSSPNHRNTFQSSILNYITDYNCNGFEIVIPMKLIHTIFTLFGPCRLSENQV